MLVYGIGNGDNRDSDQVQRINQNGPVHLLPLHEETTTVRVLFLDNAEHLELALLLKRFRRLMPHGHMLSAAGSPGGKLVQHGFFASECRERQRLPIGQRGKDVIGIRLAHLRSYGVIASSDVSLKSDEDYRSN